MVGDQGRLRPVATGHKRCGGVWPVRQSAVTRSLQCSDAPASRASGPPMTPASSGAWAAAWALLVILLAALAAMLGWWRGQRRSAALVLELQRQAATWQRLRPGLYWASDAQWRLTLWLAHGLPEPPGPWLGADLRAVIGTPSGPAGQTGCQELLAAHGQLQGLAVTLRGHADELALFAQPVQGQNGEFRGYQGVFANVQANDHGPLLQAVQAGEQPPLLLLRRQSDHAPWSVVAFCAAGRGWLAECNAPGGTPGEAPAWRQRLPAAIQQALAAPGGVADTSAEGWQLRAVAPGRGGAGASSALLYAPDSAGAGDANDALSFSFTLSHDLRAPVRVVEGFTRIVKEDYGNALDRVGNDHLDRVLGAAARMNQMIDALLAMARLATQPLARQPVNLSRLAQFVVDDLKRGAPERSIEIRIEPELQVHGDPTLLRQVLENLLGNAWKYTQRQHEPVVSFGTELVDGRRTFAVRDNGAGFDMRGVDRLFGLFQRLHSASDFPGTGVGLASVKKIVQRHGGRIWAEAEPGQGATFYFTLRD